MIDWVKRNLALITKIFLGVLLLQFFLQTFVTFAIGRDGTFWTLVWMRKEFLIVVLFLFVVWILARKYREDKLKQFRKDFPLKLFLFLFVLVVLIAFVISLFNSSISNFVISMRYSMFGFFIFLLFFVVSYLFFDKKTEDLLAWYTKIIKWVLIGSLIWRAVIWLVPSTLRHFGYNQWNFEGDVGVRPPAAYYTQYKEGFVRNQFLFERPISLGFFLVVFWPLFFVTILYKKSWKTWILRGGLYGLILLSTFSRAAWGAWFIQTIFMFLILYGKDWKKLAIRVFIPIILLVGVISYLGHDQILNREYSNTGHLKELKIAVQKVADSPFFGQGAASAGPASHHLGEGKEYNPENQYLQIWIEYGLLAFVGWMIIYVYLHMIGFWAWKDLKTEGNTKDTKRLSLIMIAFSLGLFGLSIEGFVLHSFVDRMIVYPFVVLFGMYYAIFYKEKNHLDEI
ncbi:MAG TPA: O-antigen ligase family protein [Candidatus Absconditabacterales bacterium]|nr:O-antigen ligase family protein [Candidatus Absconditabacterales bacterium]